ncbi:hypothetical protein AURDEDRAFT_163527 [Auricularia subglabra TFB-10046 SS5]|nr:hypothetical protein AURDEDRAFT_163527 [Auricularia subglabra TFB-10046 SS5]
MTQRRPRPPPAPVEFVAAAADPAPPADDPLTRATWSLRLSSNAPTETDQLANDDEQDLDRSTALARTCETLPLSTGNTVHLIDVNTVLAYVANLAGIRDYDLTVAPVINKITPTGPFGRNPLPFSSLDT